MNLDDLSTEERTALMKQMATELMGTPEEKVPTSKARVVEKPIRKVTKKAVKKIIEKATLELRPRAECEDEQEMSLEDFEEVCIQYEKDNDVATKAGKSKKEGRETILETLAGKKKFETDTVSVAVGESKNEVLDMAVVYGNLEAEELAELFQLGIVTASKPSFEKWAKGKGYNPEDFIIKRDPKKRLTVKRK